MQLKGKIVLAALSLTVALMVPSALAQGGSVTLDHVSGLWYDATGGVGDIGEYYLCDGLNIFHIRITNNTGDNVAGMTNGFRIYSPDGATWHSTRARFTPAFDQDYFDLVFAVDKIDDDGTGTDRIGFACSVMQATGMPDGFDEIAYEIAIGPIPDSCFGRTVCIDSCYFPPSGLWLWAPGGVPSWDGPHCYMCSPPPCVAEDIDGDDIWQCDNCNGIYNPDQNDSDFDGIGDACDYDYCCHIRGDINDDGNGPDIADLVYLVQTMFPPDTRNTISAPCIGAIDVNADGSRDISDLVGLVSYMFQDGPALLPCPGEIPTCE